MSAQTSGLYETFAALDAWLHDLLAVATTGLASGQQMTALQDTPTMICWAARTIPTHPRRLVDATLLFLALLPDSQA
jgi:hypothetical protein